MLANAELINYLTRVVNALDTNTLHPDARRTDVCPECEEQVRFVHDSSHVVWTRSPKYVKPNALTEIILIVACEGYWVIDPNLVGIDSPNWIHPDDHLPDYNNPDA